VSPASEYSRTSLPPFSFAEPRAKFNRIENRNREAASAFAPL
jgi:hypothetical protein